VKGSSEKGVSSSRDGGKLIPFSAIEGASSGFLAHINHDDALSADKASPRPVRLVARWSPVAPLLEVKRHATPEALVTQRTQPLGVRWSRAVTAFTACDYPVDSILPRRPRPEI
jgi:hypothetical protein